MEASTSHAAIGANSWRCLLEGQVSESTVRGNPVSLPAINRKSSLLVDASVQRSLMLRKVEQ